MAGKVTGINFSEPTFMTPRPRHLALTACALGLATLGHAQSLPDPQQTVVVTATRYPLLEIDAPAAMSVVSRRDIEARGATNLLEALRVETGVSLQGRTITGRKNFGIRGMDSRHTLILVDGKRVSTSDGVIGHSDFQLDWVPMHEIERIEVVRGPMSVLYGAEALGGVVNIITRTASDRWSGNVDIAAGITSGLRGGDSERASVQVSGPLGDRVRLGVSASALHLGALASVEDPKLSEIEGRKRDALGLNLSARVAPGHDLQWQWRSGDEVRDSVARERSGQRRYYNNLTTITRDQTTWGWTADWGGSARVQSQLRAYDSSLLMENTRSNGVVALRPQRLDDRVVEGQVSAELAPGSTTVAGFERREEVLETAGLTGGRGQARVSGVFAQHDARLNPTLSLTAGLRLDRHDRYGSEWSPRAYLVWKPAAGWTVKTGLAHGFKAPTLKQVSPDFKEDEGPNTFLGNPSLRPESNNALEFGVGHDGAGRALQAMVFRNEVKDLIFPRLLSLKPGGGIYVFDNLQRATLQGAEFSARWRLLHGMGLGLAYQYLDASDGTGKRLEKRPRHSASLRVDRAVGIWRSGVDIEWHAGQVLATGIVADPLRAVPNLTRVSAWTVVTLSKSVEANVGIDNLTSLRPIEKSPLFTYAEAPLTLRAGLRLRF